MAGLLSLVQKLVYTDKYHLSTFQHSELTAYPNRSKQTEYGACKNDARIFMFYFVVYQQHVCVRCRKT